MGVIENAREVVNTSMSSEALKAAGIQTIRNGLRTVRGSGQPVTELKNGLKAAVGVVEEGITNGAQACGQFLTLQPVKATCTVAKGLTGMCKETLKIGAAPIATGIAVGERGLGLAKDVAMLPATAPLAVCRTVKRGLTKINRGVTKVTSTFAPANDNASASESSPPPPPSAAQAA